MGQFMDHFDYAARLYDRLPSRPAEDPNLQLLSLERGACLLDVGGGTGRVTEVLNASGVRVVVCDRSRGMSRRARANGFDTVQASADALPFRSGAVDGELVVDAFHHFVNPTASIAQPLAAAELIRVLRHDGRLVVTEPDPKWWQIRIIAVIEKLLLMRSRILREHDLVRIFEAAGAQVLKIQQYGFSVQMLLSKDDSQQAGNAGGVG